VFTTLPSRDRPRVAVVGDSLTYTSTPEQLLQFETADWKVVAMDGSSGAPIPERVLRIREVVRAGPVDALVIALGTNDARGIVDSGQEPSAAWRVTQANAFTALADAKAVPCVVWVGVNSNAARFDLDTWGAWFNSWLKLYTNYADWAGYSAGHPEWFAADGVHFTNEGNHAYAKLIVDTVQSTCRPVGR